MSDTLDAIANRIRERCGDTNRGNPAFGWERVRMAVNDGVAVLLSEGIVGSAWNDSYLTLTADTVEYTLTTSVEYYGLLGVKRHSDGYVLKRETPERLESYRLNSLTARDRPTHYALIEDTSQHLRLRVWQSISTALLPESLDVQLELTPANVLKPNDTVALSVLGLAAMENYAAANLVSSMSQAEADRLLIDKASLGATLSAQGGRLIAAEKARILGFQSQSDITLVEQ